MPESGNPAPVPRQQEPGSLTGVQAQPQTATEPAPGATSARVPQQGGPRATVLDSGIAALVTAFHPDERVLDVIEAARQSCSLVVVIDNTPGGSERLGRVFPNNVRVLGPGMNLGLAGALNLGLREIDATPDVPIGTVLLMDQDSVLAPELVHGLEAILQDPTIAAASPAPWDATNASYIDPRTALRKDVTDRPAVITSGLLIRRSALADVGDFREDFFVDCVDQDFCLRLAKAGHRIVQDKRLKLPHSLGETRTHRFLVGKVRVSHHATWRLYWVFRNGVILIRENGWSNPLWSLSRVLILLRWMLLTLLYEAPRGTRLRAVVHGTFDGLFGRTSDAYRPR